MKPIIFRARYEDQEGGWIYSDGQDRGHRFWLSLVGNSWWIGHSDNDHDWMLPWKEVELV